MQPEYCTCPRRVNALSNYMSFALLGFYWRNKVNLFANLSVIKCRVQSWLRSQHLLRVWQNDCHWGYEAAVFFARQNPSADDVTRSPHIYVLYWSAWRCASARQGSATSQRRARAGRWKERCCCCRSFIFSGRSIDGCIDADRFRQPTGPVASRPVAWPDAWHSLFTYATGIQQTTLSALCTFLSFYRHGCYFLLIYFFTVLLLCGALTRGALNRVSIRERVTYI